ncbi:alpha/beta fold hydrolase [uncultured Corynebacterium sp.]|uniref:alpha/beta fold hydrolase n=1 Tax=uncultured Corynebacterium sp. TaxID=159447 RepID=UPI0025D54048|nr:alpha/beta hydrolase [uncultured Corynebacterium sp.]
MASLGDGGARARGSLGRVPGWGIVAGAGALATAAGAGLIGWREHWLARNAPSVASELLTLGDATWSGTVESTDGLELAVVERGFQTAPVTIVFTHGYCQRKDSWCLLSHRFRKSFGDDVRLLFWDQRGHGDSGDPEADACTIGHTADDLAEVIRQRVPGGKIFLVGHSMGGMTAMSFARRHPDLMERVAGVALLATASAGLSKGGIPQMMLGPVGQVLTKTAQSLPQLANQIRQLASVGELPFIRGASFGDQRTPHAIVRLNEKMIDDTSATTILNFFGALQLHDESEGVAALAGHPGVVIAGDRDRMIPYDRAVDIIERWPGAHLVRAPGAGHMVQLEQPVLVGEAIETLVRENWPV